MKTIIFICSFVLSTLGLSAQDGSHLVIKHNKKTVFVSSGEDETKNILRVTSAQLEKPGYFSINFSPVAHDSGMIRTLMIMNDLDGELESKKGKAMRISTHELKKWLDKSSSVKIYTMAIPSDPEVAARVRVRRVHLCTIER